MQSTEREMLMEKRSFKIRNCYCVFKSFGWQRIYFDIKNMYLERHIPNSLFSLTEAFCWSQIETLNPPRDTWIAIGYQQKLRFNMQTGSDSFATNHSKWQFYVNGIPKAYPGAYLVRSKRSSGSLGIFLREITSVFNYSKAVYLFYVVLNFKIACIAKIE